MEDILMTWCAFRPTLPPRFASIFAGSASKVDRTSLAFGGNADALLAVGGTADGTAAHSVQEPGLPRHA
eukprot:3833645-Rhodomonas_salina.2